MKNRLKPEAKHGRKSSRALTTEHKFKLLSSPGRAEKLNKNNGSTY